MAKRACVLCGEMAGSWSLCYITLCGTSQTLCEKCMRRYRDAAGEEKIALREYMARSPHLREGEEVRERLPQARGQWQRELEQAAFRAGGANYQAPAQLAGDFLAHRASTTLGSVRPTYRPGVTLCDLHDVLPERITSVLEQAIPALDRKLHGFANPDAVLTAPETRSSSPVRILRGETKQSVGLRGLYPCGEGAGYAGGIMSAAVDGLRCAIALTQSL